MAQTPQTGSPSPRPRRWPRRLLWALLGLFVLLLLLVGGLLLYVNTGPGERFLRDYALEAGNTAIKGKLAWDALDVRGDHFVFRGLKLYDPEGNLVAEIDTVELTLSFRSMVLRRFIVDRARIYRPRLYLVSDERGLNLARALESRNPSPEEEKPAERRPGEAFFKVDELLLQEGYVDFEQRGAERDLRVELTDLAAQGDATYQTAGQKIEANLAVQGRTLQPVEGPLAVDARVGVKGDQGGGGLKVALPGVVLDLHGDFAGETAHLNLTQADLEPATARAFLPSYPVKVPVSLSGTAERKGNLVTVDLESHAAGGKVDVEGGLDVVRLVTPGLQVRASGINLADLLDEAPVTELSLTLDAKGGGKSVETLEGELSLRVPPSRVQGEPLGPVRLFATAQDGRFQVPDLVAVLPGLQLNATASGTAQALLAKGRLEATDLSKLGRTLGRIGNAKVPPLSGRGSLGFTVQGPLRSPGVQVEGRFDALTVESVRLRALSLNANVPDVTRPLDSEGALKVAHLQSGERTFRDVAANVTSHEQQFTLDLRAGGAIDLVIDAAGLRDADSRGMELSTLSVAYADVQWTLARPARLAFRADDLSAEPLELRAAEQRLVVGGSLKAGRVDARVETERFDLSRLPKALVDPSFNLAGRVTGTVEAKGPVARPALAAKVRLEEGRFQRYEHLGFDLDATYEGDRAQGRLTAQSDVADLRARFDTPVAGLQRRRREPVEVVVELERTEVAQALQALGRPEPGAGTVEAKLIVTGTARDPLVALSVRGRDVRVGEYPPPSLERPDFDLRVESALEDRVAARIELAALGMMGAIDVRTPYTLGQLLERPPTVAQLQRDRLELDVAMNDVPLQLLESFGAPRLDGRLTLRAEARGSVRAPTVNARIDLAGAGVPGAPATDGTVALVATPERIHATVEAHRGDRRVLDLTAAVGGSIARLIEGEGLGSVPLAVDGTLHPVSLSDFRAPPSAEAAAESPPPSGTLVARLVAGGTLDAPVLRLRSNVEELRVAQSCLGRAAVALDYGAGRSDLKVDLASTNGGNLALAAQARLDLGYRAVRRGLDVAGAPIDATLRARRFDLASLSGLLPKVRSIAGLLEGDVAAQGTVGAPKVEGDLEWKDGKIALEGYGDYRDAHLKLHATNDRIQIQDLSARSGAGRLELQANADRQGKVFALSGQGKLDRFPLVYDDQLMAVITSRLTLSGDVSSELVNIKSLAIPEAHIELPEVKRKDLQDLDRPDDVVLVRNGKPLKKRKRPAGPATAPPAPYEASQDPAAAPAPSPAPTPVLAASQAEARQEEEESSLQYRFKINAPRNLWVKSTDVNMEVGLSDDFVFEYKEASAVNGTLVVHRGQLDVLGRKFDVRRDSSVRFTGPPKQPYLNVTAVHVNEREEVTVFVTIVGQGKEVSLKVNSEPPLTETEIYTLLATGRSKLKRGSGTSMNTGDAASVVGALAASQLKRTLANKLPLDVLSIESTGEGLTGARIEAGTYLTDKWYMGYTGQLGAEETENTNGVRLEYQMTPDVSVEAEYGDRRKGADIIWSRDY